MFLMLHWLILISLTMAAGTNINTDQSALHALKSHITYNPQNILATNWSTGTSACNWVGVSCSRRHRRITALELSDTGLTSTIPPKLGNLSFLVRLDFKNNSFYGSLPPELAIVYIDSSISTSKITIWAGKFLHGLYPWMKPEHCFCLVIISEVLLHVHSAACQSSRHWIYLTICCRVPSQKPLAIFLTWR